MAMLSRGHFHARVEAEGFQIRRIGNVPDRAAQRRRAVQRALRTVQYFNTIQVERVDIQTLITDAVRGAGAQWNVIQVHAGRAAQLRACGNAANHQQVCAGTCRGKAQTGYEPREVVQIAGFDLFQGAGGQRRDTARHVLDGLGAAGRRDDDFSKLCAGPAGYGRDGLRRHPGCAE